MAVSLNIVDLIASIFRKPKEPSTGVLLIDESGFSLTDGDQLRYRVMWASVEEVVAYKIDLFTLDAICLGFRVGESDRYCEVMEDEMNFDQLLEELPRRFPGIKTDWFLEVALPAFATNWTTLWLANSAK